ncbi:MAG: aldolase/citrate lyase family protein [Rhodospirillales bacterium]|nr:aldolase/citrate lyase family protein [Rhodospirillales bacterium]
MDRRKSIANIRDTLKKGGTSIGSWMQIPHASIAEIMGQSGYDWVAIDMEHGAIGENQLPDIFRALELGGTLPLVRLADGKPKECKQALDAGAGGVIVPMVESAEQLANVHRAICWPPAGDRGVGFSRANLFGKHFDAYAEEAQSPLLVAMIEHTRAVDNIDSILEVKGLDAILIGPYDLSASLGLVGQFSHLDFVMTMQKVRDCCASHKIPCGVHVVEPSLSELKDRVDSGYQFLAYSLDSVILSKGANFDRAKL